MERSMKDQAETALARAFILVVIPALLVHTVTHVCWRTGCYSRSWGAG